jgi:hypothetical protein
MLRLERSVAGMAGGSQGYVPHSLGRLDPEASRLDQRIDLDVAVEERNARTGRRDRDPGRHEALSNQAMVVEAGPQNRSAQGVEALETHRNRAPGQGGRAGEADQGVATASERNPEPDLVSFVALLARRIVDKKKGVGSGDPNGRLAEEKGCNLPALCGDAGCVAEGPGGRSAPVE